MAAPAEPATETLTFTFKTVGSVEIKVDVHVPRTSKSSLPVLFWLHGGGLTNGGRNRPYAHIERGLQKQELIGVFPDYRLCPQVRVPAVQSDVADAFKWALDELPGQLSAALPSAPRIDSARTVVMGSSAGGFLALNLVLGQNEFLPLLDPTSKRYFDCVQAVAGIYPQTQLGDPFYTRPCSTPFRGLMTAAELAPLEKFTDPNGPVWTNTGPGTDQDRNMLYRYCQQTGKLHDILFGGLSRSEWFDKTDVIAWVEKHAADIKKVLPQLLVYVTHGDSDQAVPVAQARTFVKAAEAGQIKTVYDEVAGVDHVFDGEDDAELLGLWRFIEQTSRLGP